MGLTAENSNAIALGLIGDEWNLAITRLAIMSGVRRYKDFRDQLGIANSVLYRYTYAATNEPGWFLFNGLVKHDTLTGREERYQFEPGVFCSEVGVAPRVGGTGRTTRTS